jgi:ABC-2 type transport system permease protein
MADLLLIARVRAASFGASVFSLRWQAVLKNLSSVLIFGGFAVGVFFLTRLTATYLLQEAHIGQFLFHRFLSMVLYVFFITVNLGNMIVAYSTLYKSQEVTFLMGMPLSHAKVFLVKFVDNFFYSSSTLTLVGFSVLFGYGSVFGMPVWFAFFTALFVLLPFMLIAGILAVMVLMSLIVVAARIGVRLLITLMVGGYLLAIYLYFRMTNPVQLVSEVMRHYPNVNEYFGYLDPPLVRYLPNHWVTEFLYWSVNGDIARALPYCTLLLLVMAALIVAAGIMAKRIYYRTWLVASDAEMMRGPRRSVRLRLLEFATPWMLGPERSVLLKRDLWLFLREPSQWLHLLLMGLLLMIFVVSIGSLELRMSQPLMQAVSFLVVFLFNGFLIASIALRFVFPAVSLEGDTFWAVRVSPLPLSRLYWHKFLFAFLFLLTVGEVLAVVSVSLLQHSPLLIQLSAVVTFFVVLALLSLNLGAGSYFAVYREKNPIRVASSQGASLTFLASMLYLTAVASVLVLPLLRHFEMLIRFGAADGGWVLLPMSIIALLSTLVAVTGTSIGVKALRRDF